MISQPEKARLRGMLAETIKLLCKSGLSDKYRDKFFIEGLIGITLDEDELMMVSIRETVSADHGSSQSHDSDDAALVIVEEKAHSSRKRKKQPSNDGPQEKTPKNDARDTVPKLEARDTVPKLEARDTVPKLEARDTVPKLEARDTVPKLEARDTVPKLEARDTVPKLEARDTVPKLEARDTVPKLEARDTVPKLEARDTVPKLEARDMVPKLHSPNRRGASPMSRSIVQTPPSVPYTPITLGEAFHLVKPVTPLMSSEAFHPAAAITPVGSGPVSHLDRLKSLILTRNYIGVWTRISNGSTYGHGHTALADNMSRLQSLTPQSAEHRGQAEAATGTMDLSTSGPHMKVKQEPHTPQMASPVLVQPLSYPGVHHYDSPRQPVFSEPLMLSHTPHRDHQLSEVDRSRPSPLDAEMRNRSVHDHIAHSIVRSEGSFVTSRIIGRKTGRKAATVKEVFAELSSGVDHPEHVGQAKEISRGTFVYYKCPPHSINPQALVKYGIDLETYSTMYHSVMKAPPSQHMMAIVDERSPYSSDSDGAGRNFPPITGINGVSMERLATHSPLLYDFLGNKLAAIAPPGDNTRLGPDGHRDFDQEENSNHGSNHSYQSNQGSSQSNHSVASGNFYNSQPTGIGNNDRHHVTMDNLVTHTGHPVNHPGHQTDNSGESGDTGMSNHNTDFKSDFNLNHTMEGYVDKENDAITHLHKNRRSTDENTTRLKSENENHEDCVTTLKLGNESEDEVDTSLISVGDEVGDNSRGLGSSVGDNTRPLQDILQMGGDSQPSAISTPLEGLAKLVSLQ